MTDELQIGNRLMRGRYRAMVPSIATGSLSELPAPDATRHINDRVGKVAVCPMLANCQRRLNSDPPRVDFVGVNLTHPGTLVFRFAAGHPGMVDS